MDNNGTGYIDNGDGTWTDENGNSYTQVIAKLKFEI